MKKIINTILAAAFLAGSLAACSNNEETIIPEADSLADGKLKIVTTIFPEYDWVKQMLGENASNAEVTMLLDSGVDLHSFQPTAEDILKISDCDMFVYVGGESDEWVEDALAEAANKDMRVIDLLDVLGDSVKVEEVVEGMEEEEEEGEEDEYDEHVWLSLKNAKIFCADIADELSALDPENAEIYKTNLAAYSQQLDALDADFAELAENAADKTLVFGDRFPFRYFTDDYGFDYYAAFAGCSAETEASFETIAFLSQKLDELGNDTIFVTEDSDQRIAQAIINNTAAKNSEIAVLDSMQSVTGAQAAEGVTYISAMQKNYEVLKEVLK